MLKRYKDFVLIAMLLVLLIYTMWFQNSWFWTNGTMLLGWILFVLQSLYNRGDKIYWYFQKIKYSMINPDTQWDLTINYFGSQISSSVIPLVQKALIKAAIVDRPTISTFSEQRFEIRADELTMEVYVENESLQIMFTKIPVSFRGANRTIEQRITPVLEEVEACLAIERKVYWLTVYFGIMNPFFGLYIRRLGQQRVAEMHIRVGSSKTEQLEISKQKITISTVTLNDLGTKAKKYLTLSELPV